jgi:NFU1 iron-sulfur cluster scaffold homolog, mitochondrial
MFWVDRGADILGKGIKSVVFQDRYSCTVSPLAAALFKVNGVSSVLLGPNYITVTKKSEFDWQVMKPSIELVVSQIMDAKIPLIRSDLLEQEHPTPSPDLSTPTDTASQIQQLIRDRVQPFVQQDGGDIEYVSFDEKSGVVSVRMHGACKGCPKSMITLKMGIERMLKHYVPDVVGVVDIGADEPVEEQHSKEFGP